MGRVNSHTTHLLSWTFSSLMCSHTKRKPQRHDSRPRLAICSFWVKKKLTFWRPFVEYLATTNMITFPMDRRWMKQMLFFWGSRGNKTHVNVCPSTEAAKWHKELYPENMRGHVCCLSSILVNKSIIIALLTTGSSYNQRTSLRH